MIVGPRLLLLLLLLLSSNACDISCLIAFAYATQALLLWCFSQRWGFWERFLGLVWLSPCR